MSGHRTWSLLSPPADARRYGEDTGYNDDVERICRYCSSVSNHEQFAPGDLNGVVDARFLQAILRERKFYLGGQI